jgi:hypothetical protein
MIAMSESSMALRAELSPCGNRPRIVTMATVTTAKASTTSMREKAGGAENRLSVGSFMVFGR